MRKLSIPYGKIESSCHYLLHCSNYITERLTLDAISNTDAFVLQQNDPRLLLFGDSVFNCADDIKSIISGEDVHDLNDKLKSTCFHQYNHLSEIK